MSAFLPPSGHGPSGEPDHPKLLQRDLEVDELRARWAVRAAQWRARELAEAVFGDGVESSLVGMRPAGPARGLLLLDVPFRDVETHRAGEARFLAAADDDPVLSQVPLVYVFGPRG